VSARPARRFSVVALAVALGCGGKPHASPPAVAWTPPVADATTTAPAASAARLVEVPSLDALAARATRLAPGMREILRGESAGSVPLPEADHDTCIRAAFAGGGPVAAHLVGKGGSFLADAVAATDGVIGPDGPVCYRKGDAPLLRFEGQGEGSARYVVWAAP